MRLTNKKKAVILGIFMWSLLFIVSGIVMSLISASVIGISLILIGPLISLPIAYWYLKTTPNEDIWQESIGLGVSWVLTAFSLDLWIMAVLLRIGLFYFMAWTLWVGYCEMIGFSLLLGKILYNKQRVQ